MVRVNSRCYTKLVRIRAQEHGGPHEIEWTKHRDSRTKQPASAACGRRHAGFLAAALCLGGCQSSSLQDVTGSIGGASQSDIRRSAVELGRQYDRNPDDKAIALNYARALRGLTENAQCA